MSWGAEISRQVANATERELEAARSTIAELQKRIGELEAEKHRVGNSVLTLFDKTKSGPLTASELKEINLAVMPFLLEDGRKSDLALLIARLIETVTAERQRREELEKRLEEINEDARDRDLYI